MEPRINPKTESKDIIENLNAISEAAIQTHKRSEHLIRAFSNFGKTLRKVYPGINAAEVSEKISALLNEHYLKVDPKLTITILDTVNSMRDKYSIGVDEYGYYMELSALIHGINAYMQSYSSANEVFKATFEKAGEELEKQSESSRRISEQRMQGIIENIAKKNLHQKAKNTVMVLNEYCDECLQKLNSVNNSSNVVTPIQAELLALNNILDDPNNKKSSLDSLRKFKERYYAQETQKIFDEYKDKRPVKNFLKNVGYHVVRLISAGKVGMFLSQEDIIRKQLKKKINSVDKRILSKASR